MTGLFLSELMYSDYGYNGEYYFPSTIEKSPFIEIMGINEDIINTVTLFDKDNIVKINTTATTYEYVDFLVNVNKNTNITKNQVDNKYFVAYDINLYTLERMTIILKNTSAGIKIPEDMSRTNLVVYKASSDGMQLTEVVSTIDGDYISFDFPDRIGTYVLVDKTQERKEPQIPINETTFPDKNFRDYVLQYAPDGYVNDTIRNMKGIYVVGKEITSLKGIEYFESLEDLTCGNNLLTELDVSNNKKLKILWCEHNYINELDLSNNPEIDTIWAQRNAFNKVIFGENTKLRNLTIGDNNIKEIDLSKLTSLEMFQVYNNPLTSIDFTNNTKLRRIHMPGTKIKSLDLSNNNLLESVTCSGQKLKH
ncbi:MAG: hypothetical protein ACK5LC_14495 [Coprobacillaceae bacterium]